MILFYLIAAHCLCDYPLQGDFLSKGKNRFNPLIGVPWYQCMFAHAMIHAGAVALITGVWWLGLAEFFAHFAIDDAKCAGLFDFNVDQGLHIFGKVSWFIVWVIIHA